MSPFHLTGRKALVTGGARGLGAGMAVALAAAGAAVMIGDVLEEQGRETARALAATGARAAFVHMDVTDEAHWLAAISATHYALGGFDILINNAGVEVTALVTDIDPDELRRMLDVNIVGTALGIKHAFRAMRPGDWPDRAVPWSTFRRWRRPSHFRRSPGIRRPSPPWTGSRAWQPRNRASSDMACG